MQLACLIMCLTRAKNFCLSVLLRMLQPYFLSHLYAAKNRGITTNPSDEIDGACRNRFRARADRCWTKKDCESRTWWPVTYVTDTHLRGCCLIQIFLNGNFEIEFVAPHGGLGLDRKSCAYCFRAVRVEEFCVKQNLIHNYSHWRWQPRSPSSSLWNILSLVLRIELIFL